VNSVDKGDNLEVIVWCDHVPVSKNPLFSTTPNVVVSTGRSVYLVVEESKVKLLCWNCVLKATRQNQV